MSKYAILAATMMGIASCACGGGFDAPHPTGENAAIPAGEPPHPATASPAADALQRHRSSLLAIPGVIGVGNSLTPSGADAIDVFISDPGAASALPADIEGYPVQVHEVPGGFHAY